MRAGVVSTIRVNPRDAQSILDVLDAAGVPRHALSFAQCTSLALGALLETARQNGLIPEPDEFEYLNRLGPYIGPGRKSKKAKMATAIHNLGGSMRAPALPETVGVQTGSSRFTDAEDQPEPATAKIEASPEVVADAKIELKQLLEESERFGPVEDWPRDRAERYLELYKIVYPDG